MYAKQFAAQASARQGSGNLSSRELAEVGIGKDDRVLNRREKVQQVGGGLAVVYLLIQPVQRMHLPSSAPICTCLRI
jgi:hypothetical protein